MRKTLDGRYAWLGDGVQRALGRQPRDFLEFCQAAAASGGWERAACGRVPLGCVGVGECVDSFSLQDVRFGCA
jgi:hypothetical protein